MSSLDHPNIHAELREQPPPVPTAIRLERLKSMLFQWSDPLAPGSEEATDIPWPPLDFCAEKWATATGGNLTTAHREEVIAWARQHLNLKFLRPGPLAQARLLGVWASSGCGVWSETAWNAALTPIPILNPAWKLVIGCDVARFGDDYTAIHVRLGPCSLHHERRNGWSTSQTASRLKQLAREWAAFANTLQHKNAAPLLPEKVPIRIDDDGVGGGVTDQAAGGGGLRYLFVGVSAANLASDVATYPRRRDELWFNAVKRAKTGAMDLSRLDKDTLRILRGQCLAPTYDLTPDGRLRVETKDKVKERLGHSPDDADALNLAFLEMSDQTYHTVEKSIEKKTWHREDGGHFGGR